MSDTQTTSEEATIVTTTAVAESDARDGTQPDATLVESAVDATEGSTEADSSEADTPADEDASESAPAEQDASEDGPAEVVDELEAEGDIAADYLEELLDIADLDGDIDTYSEGGRAHVSVVTTSDVLVGRDGEVLDALQELARLAVMTEAGHRSRLMLDVAGFREKRRQELQILARDAVEEARESAESVRLAPMNPFERKIVHDVVAAAGLSSESEGVEPQRRVVIEPRD